ncbi:oxidoreductase [Dyadobacter sediminis]|uniref:SDR family NAD(P)-dependent oxidoreductase n=1 Tax=Dyadobacter sediminis TaxID=1493691 RepID=A0A5R9KBB4_9BACT|nr:oxidoreductase [Dyadobacter sediminis]TLU92096.1 SDR family NAD(P)-dependent oxidoreductase [Dyadobacter sediminis]GGB97478.1 short-chain dehydrogenase/reductase [Dyadobacter sediminis]
MKKTVLVTGASAGIGKATAIYLAQNGYQVYGAARRIDQMQDLKTYGIKPIVLDVTKEESITACVSQIFREEGSIAILVNNAGFGMEGAIEDIPMQDARYQLEVNVFGAMRLAQLVLPKMRENGYGKIVNISSVGGKIAFPLGGWYHASKFALEALSDSMRSEVKQFGIDVIVVEPGATRSEWGNVATDLLMKVSGHTAYKDLAAKTHQLFTRLSKQVAEPEVIARLVRNGIEAKSPKTRYTTSQIASSLLLFLKRVLSDKQMDKLILSQIK